MSNVKLVDSVAFLTHGPRETITNGGKPSKGTPPDKRLKENKPLQPQQPTIPVRPIQKPQKKG